MIDFNLTEKLIHSFTTYANQPAFCFNGVYFSYAEIQQKIAGICKIIKQDIPANENYIGVIANFDVETYCSLLAIMLCGKGYMPLEPHHPADRNALVVKHSEVKYILTSDNANYPFVTTQQLIYTSGITSQEEIQVIRFQNQPAYLLFTSGSTGIPKGVPISMFNVNAFLDAFFSFGFEINEHDRFLQMFDLTFDLSVMSYLAPLCIGACVYPVPADGVKAMKVYEMLDEYQITFALMVPSVINFLQPYFDDIDLPHLKYSQFCGEALLEDATRGWQQCCKNAFIQNVYGPTENTIYCLYYDCSKEKIKSVNGIISIGKPMKHVQCGVFDDNNNLLAHGERGELCLAGDFLTAGYWNDSDRNKSAFFIYENVRYYRTGDIAYCDKIGDYMYAGRMDQQIKIQGFRVELSEIEHHTREILQNENAICVSEQTSEGLTRIHLFIQATQINQDELIKQLRLSLPDYMIPAELHVISDMPLNVNGKVDRKKLKEMLNVKF